MDNTRSEMWIELKDGLGVVVKIIIYSFLGVGLLAGVGYVYVACCQ